MPLFHVIFVFSFSFILFFVFYAGLLNEHLYRPTYSDQQNDDNRSGVGDDDTNFSESFMGIDES